MLSDISLFIKNGFLLDCSSVWYKFSKSFDSVKKYEIEYSDKYHDDLYEYRHVLLPKAIYKSMPKGRLLSENEWRSLGVQQSRGWVHYEIHKPEPHILLFRRPLGTDPNTGIAPPEILEKIKIYNEKLYEQQQNLEKEKEHNK